jgi:hypothetical protein
MSQAINQGTLSGSFRTDDSRRFDADETVNLALALEDLRTKVYSADYPELKARKLLAVENDVDTGADTFSYEESDYVGEAKVLANLSDDFPKVNVKSTKVTNRIVALGDAYSYSIQDLRRAAFAGKPLSSRKAEAARRIWERALDRVVAYGAPDEGIASGICNRSMGTGASQVRFTAATATAWDSTPDAAGMIADANKAVAEFIVDSKETQTPDMLVLPTAQYLRFSQTMTTDGNPEPAMLRFLKTNGFVSKVESWDRLAGVDTGGTESRGLLCRKDPDSHSIVIPQEFEVFAPQQRNLVFEVLCHGRTAGCAIYRPLALRYISLLPNA